MANRIVKLLILIFLSACSLTAQASFPLYAIDGNFPADSNQTSQLYRIDPNSGNVLDVIGDTGLNLTTIVWWPPTGTFFATTTLDTEPPSHLESIDPFTAETELL